MAVAEIESWAVQCLLLFLAHTACAFVSAGLVRLLEGARFPHFVTAWVKEDNKQDVAAFSSAGFSCAFLDVLGGANEARLKVRFSGASHSWKWLLH